MSKNKITSPAKAKKVDFEKEIMSRVISGKITMKPKWYFVLGSILMTFGFVSLAMGAVFLTNLTIFLIRKRGPGIGRLNMMLDSFPLWIPFLAVCGIVLGLWFLKKYDFSYKKNFRLIIAGFIASVLVAAFMIDYLGLNEMWSRGRMIRRFYQKIENRENITPKGQGGQGRMQNNRSNGY